MGRLCCYRLTVLASIYGQRIASVVHRGWTKGRINSLTNDATLVETMHVSLPFLVSHIGYRAFRVLFLVGLMILLQPNHSAWVAAIFGVMTGEIGRTLTDIGRVNSYDTYIPQLKLKIEKLNARLPASSGSVKAFSSR